MQNYFWVMISINDANPGVDAGAGEDSEPKIKLF